MGLAWRQADDLLAKARNEGAILNDETILKAVKLAEEYLNHIPADSARVNKTKTADESDSTSTSSKKEKDLETKVAHLQRENAGLKKKGKDGCPPRDGKPHGERQVDSSIPVCTKCNRRHKGKCLLERDLDAEQKNLDKAKKLKEFIAKPDKTKGADGATSSHVHG